MSKSDWSNGSHLTPTFMDTFFGTDATTGHLHTGLNADGSAPRIDGTAHINYHAATVDVTSNDVTGGLSGTWFYECHGKIVNLFVTSDMIGIARSNTLNIYPKTEWPAELRAGGSQQTVPYRVWNNNTVTLGYVMTPNAPDATMICAVLSDGSFNSGAFTGMCGVGYGLITYYKV